MKQPHIELMCFTSAGVGAGLKWTVTVDGLASTEATTSCSPPWITIITEGVSGLPVKAARAGSAFIDFIAYGPYTAVLPSIVQLNARELTFVPGPGIGAYPLVIYMGGQPSPPSTQVRCSRGCRSTGVSQC